MIITGSNASASNTTVTGGILNVRNSNAFGSSGQVTQVNRLGGIQLQGGVSIPNTITFLTSNDGTGTGAIGYAIENVSGDNTINGAIRMTAGGGGTVIQSTGGTLTLAGPVNSDSTRSLILQGTSTGANTVSGVISNGAAGTAGLTKTGTGTWYVTGANTYTGATLVSGGTLYVNGSLGNTAVTVDGGTLAGTGSIGGSVTVGNASYSPGTSPGSMEIAGSLTLGVGTITDIELGGTAFTLNGTEQYDRTKLTGTSPTLTLAGTLAISLFGGFTLEEGQAFGIFQLESGATLAGAFAGLSEGSVVGNFGGEDLYITYQGDFGDSGPVATSGGNDVVLYTIPEPSSAVAFGLLSTLLLLRRRNR
jgi:fibronectin-binding autotransporter adhesin